MSHHIRPMEEKDWERVSDIYLQGIETNFATFQTDIPTYETWDHSHLKEFRYVVESNNRVLGWVALSQISSRCVYKGVAEVSIYIDRASQNQGYGKLLLNHICNYSEQNGIWTLQSGIMQNNIASIKLHESCGFRMVGYREKIAKDKFGEWRNTVLMERRSKVYT